MRLEFLLISGSLVAFAASTSYADLSACPAHVKTQTAMADVSSLPMDGSYVYRDAQKNVWVSRIKNPAPKKCPAEVTDFGKMTFSPDGKWILGSVPEGTARTVAILKADGSAVKKLGITASQVVFYYSSPKESVKDGKFEFAYIDPAAKTICWAQIIDLSGATPVLGEKRKIGEGLKESGNEEIAVAGGFLCWDSRALNSGAAVVYTIPDRGLGIATQFYGVYPTFNCAVGINMSGSMWNTNIGRLDDPVNHCIPGSVGTHSGFVVLKTKLATEPKVSMLDWVMKPEKGAVSINWSPEKIGNLTTRATHEAGKITTFGWYAGPWTNHDDYLVEGLAMGTNSKLFITNWKTNTYHEIAKGSASSSGAAWFDGVSYPPATDVKQSGAHVYHGKKVTRLEAFRSMTMQDAMGRRVCMKDGAGLSGSGLLVSKHGRIGGAHVVGGFSR